MKDKSPLANLSEEEHREIIEKAVRKANKEQRELVEEYNKLKK